MPGPTPLTTPNGSSIASRIFEQLHHWLQWGAPYPPLNWPHPVGRSPPRQPASSLDLADPTPKTASRSSQPFCTIHRTDIQTDRPTD